MPPCSGFPVYGVGQPSEAGFSGVADKVNPKDKLIWFNMRQEPVAYVGGKSVTPRKTPNPHHNIEIPGKVADMEALEVSVKQTCKKYLTKEYNTILLIFILSAKVFTDVKHSLHVWCLDTIFRAWRGKIVGCTHLTRQ